MSSLALSIENILIGVVALALAVLFWRVTRGARALDTIVMRTALLLLMAPFVIAAVIGAVPNHAPTAPAPTARTETAPAPKPVSVGTAKSPASPSPAPQSAPVPPPRQEAAVPPPPPAPPAAAPRAPEPSSTPTPAQPAPSVREAVPLPPTPADGGRADTKSATQEAIERLAQQQAAEAARTAEAARAAEAARTREAARTAEASRTAASPPPVQAAPAPPAVAPGATPPPPPAPIATAPADDAAKKEPWDVVPVYYGTDRVAVTNGPRLTYGADRARRLELGRALVTVPKTHEVPNVERPWVYRLPFSRIVLFEEKEDPARHFTVKEIKAMSREELAQIVRDRLGASSDYKDQALVFLHGFNNAFENALFRTAQIAYDLKFDGAPFMYSWPSKGQLGLQDYSYDRESSTQAEPYLRQFLEFVTKETGAKSVNIIAHSMGNQVLLNVLRELKRLPPADVHIGEVILAAPDVDRDTFEFLAKEISGFGKGITVLASANDRALEASKRFWGGVPRAGDMAGGTPVLVSGIDTIDISTLSTDFLSLNHSSYAESQNLLSDLRALLKDGTRPNEKRAPPLDRVTTDKGIYWRYPAPR